jgi:integrase
LVVTALHFLIGIHTQADQRTRMSLNAFLENYWFPSIRDQVSGKTLDRYRLDLGYCLPYLGQKRLAELSSRDILTAYSQMQLDGLTDYQRFKAGKLLRQALKLAVRREYIRRNPADDFPLPKFKKGDIRTLEPEQVRAFLGANQDDRLYALYVTALDTGARQGELFALEWENWTSESRELYICRSVEDHKGILREKESKTKACRRKVVVSPKTATVLAQHRERMAGEKEFHQSSLIFPNVDGQWLRCSNFHRDCFKPALKRAGLPDIRFHDLRHTCATLLLLAGDSVNSIADRLGHSSPEMIWRTYGHVLPRMRRESAALMEQFL